MKKQHWIITSLAALTMLAFGLVGCQNFENNSLTTPDLSVQPDFIVGDAEIDDWGGQYGEDNAYFMLNIPVTGAMQIAYTIQGGGSYNLFGIAGAAVKQEIGLRDGDLLDSVCVSYDGSDSFSAMPANAQESRKGNFLQYQRLNDDGSVAEWWSNTAGFEFSGDTTTVCVVSDGVVTATEVEGPFPKPTAEEPSTRSNWAVGTTGETCDAICTGSGYTGCNATRMGQAMTTAECTAAAMTVGVDLSGHSPSEAHGWDVICMWSSSGVNANSDGDALTGSCNDADVDVYSKLCACN
jgi:hypothetical protein